ncbi:MAG TPA: sterol desaturase family protein [Burkholderiales bacterium]|nr:sterol desaturase family protein [Burkholderiales bacterium]
MLDTLINHEAQIKVWIFLSVFATLAVWEIAAPRRALLMPKAKRWLANLGILIINSMAVRVVFPAAAVGMAAVANRRGIGLLHAVDLPQPLEIVLAFIALDLAIYVQHVMFHAIPLLWRLHRVHHADLDFDVTTGTRFHPVEILLSMLIKAAAIFVIGAPVLAVLLFEITLNVTSMFNHSNIRIPQSADGFLRLFLVTPDMHRVHHSIESAETNSNFGFNVPWWDRLFGTYRPEPAAGHEQMTIGIEQFRTQGDLRLDRILLQPFHADTGDYPINRRPATR